MRAHVGAHILQGDLINNANPCGYCIGENCIIQLKITSGFGAKATYGPFSNFDNFVKFSLVYPVLKNQSVNVSHPEHESPSLVSQEEMIRLKDFVI